MLLSSGSAGSTNAPEVVSGRTLGVQDSKSACTAIDPRGRRLSVNLMGAGGWSSPRLHISQIYHSPDCRLVDWSGPGPALVGGDLMSSLGTFFAAEANRKHRDRITRGKHEAIRQGKKRLVQ